MSFNQRKLERHTEAVKAGTQAVPGRVATSLQKRRHAGIFEAMHRLDVGLDDAARRELSDWIAGQYEAEYGDVPLGFVAICHLGPPFVDHRLDLIFSILDHFGPSEVMPPPFAAARMLARSGAYEFVEVYASGQLIPVHADGTAVTS